MPLAGKHGANCRALSGIELRSRTHVRFGGLRIRHLSHTTARHIRARHFNSSLIRTHSLLRRRRAIATIFSEFCENSSSPLLLSR